MKRYYNAITKEWYNEGQHGSTVINSQATWTKLYSILKTSKGDITIDITK